MSFASKARFALAVLSIGGATLAATTAVTATSAEARRLVIRTGFVHVHRHHFVKPRYVVPLATVVVGSACAYRWRHYKTCWGY